MTEFKLGMIVFLLNFLIDSKNLRTERAGKIEAHWRKTNCCLDLPLIEPTLWIGCSPALVLSLDQGQNLREGKDITSWDTFLQVNTLGLTINDVPWMK
jgi:hypothetical protein